MDPATLGGWAFPDVPRTARLVLARGSLFIPAAGALGYADGDSPTAGVGGTGYIAARELAMQRNSADARVRLLALGVGLRDGQAIKVGAAAIGAGGALILPTVLAMPIRLQNLKVRQLRIYVTSNAGSIVIGGASHVLPVNVVTVIENVTLTDTDSFGGSGFAYNVLVHATIDADVLAEDVTVRLVKRTIDLDTLAVVKTSIVDGGAYFMRPEPLGPGQRAPTLYPVVHPSALLDPGEAFGISGQEEPDGILPVSAYLDVRAALAVWEPWEEA